MPVLMICSIHLFKFFFSVKFLHEENVSFADLLREILNGIMVSQW